jgi:MGT family glycosyltransferase
MKRPHLAIFTEMGNGHVFPVLPLCSEFSARGNRVTCATNDRFSRHVHASGAEAVVFKETPVDDALRAESELRFRLPATDLARFDFSELEWSYMSKSNDDFLAQTLEFYERNVPDLILYNRYCIPGRIIANRLSVPAVQLSPHFAYHGRSRFWDRGIARNPQELAAYGERLDSLLAAHGLTTEQNLWHVERLNVHFVPREFQYRHDLFDETFFFSGSLLDRPFQSMWRRDRLTSPLVLVSGYSGLPATQVSNLRYFQTFIDALADVQCHCILSIGDRLTTRELGNLPDNFEVNQRASHLEILPHATLFACHGGMGSSLEALYNGVPVLAIPSTPYTEEVAYRIAELQVGKLLPQNDFGIDSIRQSVAQMLNDAPLQRQAKAIQQAFLRSGGTVAAVERIERFLQEVN